MNDGSTKRPKVLLVDDEEDVRRGYAKMLRGMGFDVETAADGQEAKERVHAGGFDVMLSDIAMPNMNGLEFLRAVRQRDLDVPVVLMTGQPSLDSAVQAVEHGAFRYLGKPVDFDDLEKVMRRALTMHRIARLKREALGLLGTEGRQLGDRASLETRFDSALDGLWMAYQPIVDWKRRIVVAYEALVRSAEPSLEAPAGLLDAAERLDRLRELGRRIRDRVGIDAEDAPDDALLFVNLHSIDLEDPELYSPSSRLARIADRVVLEITERASLVGVADLANKMEQLRELGYRIAIDDLGAGYAGLSTFTQLEPEFVKLDMSLVRGVDTSTTKRTVVRSITALCMDELAIRVVSEGVETAAERDALADDGCDLLQGFLFARPGRGFPRVEW